MKQYLLLFLLAATCGIGACKSNKSFLERTNEDKALQDAVKKLNKSPDDADAILALPILYKNISAVRLAKIKSLESSKEIGRWDKIISEYNQLQSAYTAIINSTPAFKLVTPENFGTQLLETKEAAAADYYNLAESYFVKAGRDNAKKAYSNFKKTENYVPGYKDASAKMNEAYENAIVDVVINPVQDNSFFISNGWGNSWTSYSNDYFQRTLVRDLDNSSNNNSRYAARFYSDWEVRNKDIQPDWAVNLTLRNLDIPSPQRYNYSRSRSNRIEIGRDTANKPVYQTVTATVRFTRYSFTAYASMDVQINDLQQNRSISNRNYREDYRWEEQTASYSGDSRALSNEDWAAINNSNFREPARERVVEELYKKLYSDILSHIRNTVEW